MTTVDPEPPVIVDRTVNHVDDVAAIRAIVADIETGLNTNDADLMTVHFAENAVVVGANGIMLSGRRALRDAHARGLAGFLRDEYVRYNVIDVLFLRADIAVAHKDARAAEATGTLLEQDPTMIAVYVLSKERDRWWIVARQNTLIPS